VHHVPARRGVSSSEIDAVEERHKDTPWQDNPKVPASRHEGQEGAAAEGAHGEGGSNIKPQPITPIASKPHRISARKRSSSSIAGAEDVGADGGGPSGEGAMMPVQEAVPCNVDSAPCNAGAAPGALKGAALGKRKTSKGHESASSSQATTQPANSALGAGVLQDGGGQEVPADASQEAPAEDQDAACGGEDKLQASRGQRKVHSLKRTVNSVFI
jgi:hypothetical protein